MDKYKWKGQAFLEGTPIKTIFSIWSRGTERHRRDTVVSVCEWRQSVGSLNTRLVKVDLEGPLGVLEQQRDLFRLIFQEAP